MRNVRTEKEIISNWQGDPANPVVSVSCITYNHEKYIEDAMEGFLFQETDFPFEILIHDDASTDRTADIIREYSKKYPCLIKPIYQAVNQFSQGKKPTTINISRAKGKYIALCEGDDYWTDQFKLQKQVDFLETHPDYGMVHTDYNYFEQILGKLLNSKLNDYFYIEDTFNEILLSKYIIATCTVMIRTQFINDGLKFSFENFTNALQGDLILWLYIAKTSKIKYLTDITGVYRILEQSASHSKDIKKILAFQESSLRIRLFFATHYETQKEVKEIVENKLNQTLLKKSFFENDSLLIKKFFLLLKNKNVRDYIFYYSSKNIILYKLVHLLVLERYK